MPDGNSKAHYLAAVGIGVVHALVLAAIWGVLARNMPFIGWIIDDYGGIWSDVLLRSVIYVHDLIINLVVAFPFALLIARLNPAMSWKYLWIAVSIWFLLLNWSLFTDIERSALVFKMWSFYIGSLVMVIALPLAFALVAAFRSRSNVA